MARTNKKTTIFKKQNKNKPEIHPNLSSVEEHFFGLAHWFPREIGPQLPWRKSWIVHLSLQHLLVDRVEIGQLTDAVGETSECVEQASDLMMAQFELCNIVGQQDFEGRPQSIRLDLAPQATLVTRNAVHNVEGYVVEMGGNLLGQSGGLIAK